MIPEGGIRDEEDEGVATTDDQDVYEDGEGLGDRRQREDLMDDDGRVDENGGALFDGDNERDADR
jgi:hypothetical protein